MSEIRYRLQYFSGAKWVRKGSQLSFPALTDDPQEAMEFHSYADAEAANTTLPALCLCRVEAFNTPENKEPTNA